jgi:hypothetical protein
LGGILSGGGNRPVIKIKIGVAICGANRSAYFSNHAPLYTTAKKICQEKKIKINGGGGTLHPLRISIAKLYL